MMEQLDHLSPLLRVWVRWTAEDAAVFLCGDLDMTTAPEAQARLSEVLAQRPTRLVLDLRKLSFIDSAGISALIRTRRTAPDGCPIVLRSPNPTVSKVLRITGADRIFALAESTS